MWVYRKHRLDKKVVLDYQETRQTQWPKQVLKNLLNVFANALHATCREPFAARSVEDKL